MPDPDFYVKQNDTASVLADVLKDEDSVAVNLTGATVKFSMQPLAGGAMTIADATATNGDVSEATRGNVSYTWAAVDTDTAGWYLGEWKVTYSGGKIQTFPNGGYILILIEPELATSTPRYLTLEEFKGSKELTNTVFADDDLTRALNAAEGEIEGLCGRRFWSDTAATNVRYYTPTSPNLLLVDDVITLTSLLVDPGGDGTFEETWVENTDFTLEPFNNPSETPARPRWLVKTHPLSTHGLLPTRYPRTVKVTAKFGWVTVPYEIEQAVGLLASRLVIRSREAPLGVVALGLDAVAGRIAREDPDVRGLIAPFVKRGPGMV
ncbi:MAG TPA: hypothetical protein VJ206_07510 [bacterium]|nr:hypothetical protein [bacterium]